METERKDSDNSQLRPEVVAKNEELVDPTSCLLDLIQEGPLHTGRAMSEFLTSFKAGNRKKSEVRSAPWTRIVLCNLMNVKGVRCLAV